MKKLHPNHKLTCDTFEQPGCRSIEGHLHHLWPWLVGYFEEADAPYYVFNDGEQMVTTTCDVSIILPNGDGGLPKESQTVVALQATKRNSHGMWSAKTTTGFVKQLVPAINHSDDVILVFPGNDEEEFHYCFHLHRRISTGELYLYGAAVPKASVSFDLRDNPATLLELLSERFNFQPNFSTLA